jgi:hypothetical protein
VGRTAAGLRQADAVVLRQLGCYRTLAGLEAWTERIATVTRLWNPIELVRWNLRKNHVGALAAARISVPQSHFIDCTAARWRGSSTAPDGSARW